jgi:hypothetical protein
MPNVAPPLWSRSHSEGAVAVIAGDFYTGSQYPSSFVNSLFLSDFGDTQLRVLRVNPNMSLNSVAPLNLSVGAVVEMSMGRDGYMYFVDLVGNRVGRLIFTPSGASLLAAEPGDFNGDAEVDGADFLAWQRGLGTAGDAATFQGDADGDGDVTGDDLRPWMNAFSARGEQASGSLQSSSLASDVAWLAFLEADESSPSNLAMMEPPLESAPSTSAWSPKGPTSSSTAESSSLLTVEDAVDDAFAELVEDNPFAWVDAL